MYPAQKRAFTLLMSDPIYLLRALRVLLLVIYNDLLVYMSILFCDVSTYYRCFCSVSSQCYVDVRAPLFRASSILL